MWDAWSVDIMTKEGSVRTLFFAVVGPLLLAACGDSGGDHLQGDPLAQLPAGRCPPRTVGAACDDSQAAQIAQESWRRRPDLNRGWRGFADRVGDH
jgi:hypothetical protein